MKKAQLIFSLFFCFAICSWTAQAQKKQNINVVFIGNSITQGALMSSPEKDAPPVKTADFLRNQPEIGTVQFANCGVSGCTTLDYLPASQNLFPKAQQAADQFSKDKSAQLIFSIMLGTNDSAVKGPNGSPISPKQYQTNMSVIIDRLLTLYPDSRVVLHRPIWYSPNTYNGSIYLLEGQKRLASYLPELEILVANYAQSKPGRVWMGDKDGWGYFETNYLTDIVPENGNAGIFYLHPNEKGATKLGEFWGKAILPVINTAK